MSGSLGAHISKYPYIKIRLQYGQRCVIVVLHLNKGCDQHKKGDTMNKLALAPSYWASVSGGKDSLLMLQIILKNPDKYPLNGVVHAELEIDYPFISSVVDEMEKMVKPLGIPFLRIKPESTWEELYIKYGFPTRVARWCNSDYKLNAIGQLTKMGEMNGYNVIHYIGYCVDEVKRYEKRKSPNEIYPLVLEGIEERYILEWAKNQPCFNDFYKYFNRCGCMKCPMITNLELAYQLKYYPELYAETIQQMYETEKRRASELGRPFAVRQSNPKYNALYTDNVVRTKWLKKLEEMEKEYNDK